MLQGNWARVPSTTGAGGQKVSSVDRGWASANAPLASPSDYFEASFNASAGVPYRVWLRLRATGDSRYNESVWVQFSNAVTATGAALWRVGSTSALLVNLENCSGCGVSGWGWQDNAYWLETSSVVRFAASGSQTIRVQTREDGVDVDQIVLSPATYASVPPGGLRDDATIVPKGGGGVALLRGPYLQQVGHDRAAIAWTTREPGSAEVRFRLGTATSTVTARTRLFRASATGLAYDFYQHEAWLEGLSPSTTYTYDVFVAGTDATGSSDTFRTAPRTGSGTVTFVAFGDSGTGSTPQRQLASRLAADAFDFAVHTGDVVYGISAGTGSAGYRQYDEWFFGIYAQWLRSRPMFPSIGNHDNEVAAGQAYRDVFLLPVNGASGSYPDHAERYYSFDYGPVHVAVLDTETAFLDPGRQADQLDWLDADLAGTPQPWKVVVFHRPPYSSGAAHGSDLAVRAAFAPLFERRGVQLVLTGHDHDYERSKPLREHAPDGKPVTYIVSGGGGAGLTAVGTSTWTAVASSVFHYVRVSAGTGCSMSVHAVAIDGGTVDRFSIDRCSAPPPPAPAPSLPVPGTIEAEDFDAGANGTAYRDTSVGNSGGQYRTTDVDIERAAEGGYNVGWIAAGEWLHYTVNVQAAGTYRLDARVASPSGGSFHAEFGGADKTGPIGVPATGGWQAWRTVSRTVTLSAGTQVMRLAFDTAGFNINYVRLVAETAAGGAPYGGTARTLPGRLESEDFDEGGEGVAYHDTSAGNSGTAYRQTAVDIQQTGDAGGGFNVGWVAAGEWMNYTVNVPAAGSYTLSARVASPGSGGTFHVELNGVNVTGSLRVPDTGGWQVYRDVTARIAAGAGRQVLRVVMESNGSTGAVGNFNYLAVF